MSRATSNCGFLRRGPTCLSFEDVSGWYGSRTSFRVPISCHCPPNIRVPAQSAHSSRLELEPVESDPQARFHSPLFLDIETVAVPWSGHRGRPPERRPLEELLTEFLGGPDLPRVGASTLSVRAPVTTYGPVSAVVASPQVRSVGIALLAEAPSPMRGLASSFALPRLTSPSLPRSALCPCP